MIGLDRGHETTAGAIAGGIHALSEMKYFLKEFVARINHVELTGPTVWVKNNFLGGPKRMKVNCAFAN